MKSWKSLWKKELDEIVPTLCDDVKNEPIILPQKEINDNKIKSQKTLAWFSLYKKPIFACLSFCVILVSMFLIVPLLKPTQPENNSYAVMLEINPKVMFSVNEENKIENVVALNSDADVILSKQELLTSILGSDFENGVKTYVDYACQLGYVDLSNQSAIKLSGYQDTQKIEVVTQELEDYFCEKGSFVLVINQNLSLSEFCEKAGLPISENKNKLVEKINSISKLYSDRIVNNESVENQEKLENLYNEMFSNDTVSDILDNELKKHSANIDSYFNKLNKLKELNTQILESPDNPKILDISLDYWNIKNNPLINVENLKPEFKEIFSEFEKVVLEFEKEYDEIIDNTIKFELLYANATYLKELINNFSLSSFSEKYSDIISIMNKFGIDFENITKINQKPQSLNEYKDYVNKYSSSRKEKYDKVYNEERQKIEKSDYLDFKQQIINEYGSLEQYWNNLKNK